MVKAKLRLIARGFRQCEGIDVSETFASIVSSSCVLLLSAIACVRDLGLCHFDVDQAFVQFDLKGGVFLLLSKGCDDRSGKVIRLNKCLYGLKQASRTLHAHLTTCLKVPDKVLSNVRQMYVDSVWSRMNVWQSQQLRASMIFLW